MTGVLPAPIPSPLLRRFVVALAFTVVAVITGTVGASAVAPPDHLDGPITDQAGVLSAESRAELQAALDRLPADQALYVVYVDSFDGLDGAQWAAQTHDRAGLGSAWLFAVATGDRLWGTGYLTGTDDGHVSAVNHAAQTALSGYADNPADFDWATPAIAVAQAVADPDSVHQGPRATTVLAIVLGTFAVVGAIVIPLSIRAHRLAKERAEAEFSTFWSQEPLPSDPQESLEAARRQISIAVDFLTAHDALVSPLARGYVQLAMDLYESAKAALSAGESQALGRPIPQVLDDARAYARAGLGTATNDVGDALPPKQLSRQFGFDMNLQTWAVLQATSDYPTLDYEPTSVDAGGSRSVTASYRGGASGSFEPALTGVGGAFGSTRVGVGGTFDASQNGLGGSFDSRTGSGGSFTPTHSFDRGPGGDLYVEPSSGGGGYSSASFGGSSGSGGSF